MNHYGDIKQAVLSYRLNTDIQGLEAYLSNIQTQGVLAASLATCTTDINYRNAESAANALVACGYESYAAPIYYVLWGKPKAGVCHA